MCEPTTAILAITAITAAVSAASAVKQGNDAKKVANANADAQEQAGRDAVNAGNAQAEQQRQQGRQLAGRQAAAFGANGTDMTSGSALNTFGDTASGTELDALTTINNAQRQAAGLDFQASASRAQGQIDQNAGYSKAGSTILNATLSGFSAYQTMGLGASAASSGTGSSTNMFTAASKQKYGTNAFTF
ncbi:MAG: hypothetical protein ACREXO_00060 [Advenella sp.]|uniref:hypothetical protein n=1 Tax=Rahnella sp. AN3-3W3 TaxID=1610578 RepID=UPI001E547459|nr:hypothetical protein [Rahnella sp. AN3-3W3]